MQTEENKKNHPYSHCSESRTVNISVYIMGPVSNKAIYTKPNQECDDLKARFRALVPFHFLDECVRSNQVQDLRAPSFCPLVLLTGL